MTCQVRTVQHSHLILTWNNKGLTKTNQPTNQPTSPGTCFEKQCLQKGDEALYSTWPLKYCRYLSIYSFDIFPSRQNSCTLQTSCKKCCFPCQISSCCYRSQLHPCAVGCCQVVSWKLDIRKTNVELNSLNTQVPANQRRAFTLALVSWVRAGARTFETNHSETPADSQLNSELGCWREERGENTSPLTSSQLWNRLESPADSIHSSSRLTTELLYVASSIFTLGDTEIIGCWFRQTDGD